MKGAIYSMLAGYAMLGAALFMPEKEESQLPTVQPAKQQFSQRIAPPGLFRYGVDSKGRRYYAHWNGPQGGYMCGAVQGAQWPQDYMPSVGAAHVRYEYGPPPAGFVGAL